MRDGMRLGTDLQRLGLERSAGSTSIAGVLFLGIFGAVFALAGLASLVFGLPDALGRGDREAALVAGVLGTLFTGIGAGVVWLALRGHAEANRSAELRARHPDSPWMWNPEWASREIQGDTKVATIGIWVVAAIWNAISWPLVPKVVESMRGGEHQAGIALIFPVVGLLLLYLAVRATARWRRFGSSTLQLDTLPGVIGGELAGTVRVARSLPMDTLGARSIQIRLACIRRRRVGSGKNASTHESVLYEDKQSLPLAHVSRGPLGSQLPVRFTIPFDNRDSDDSNPRDRILWRLELRAELEGADYETRFEVPVFRTSESSADVVETLPEAADLDAAMAGRGPLEGSKVGVRPLPAGGVELYFGPARNPGVAAGLTAFALIWGGVTWSLFAWTDAPRIMTGVFAAIGAFVAYGALSLWLGRSRVRAEGDALFVSSGLLGGGSGKRILAADIEEIEPEVGMQAGTRTYYRLRVKTREGRGVTAGSGIPERDEALALIALLERALGR